MGLSPHSELADTLSNPSANQLVNDRVADTVDTFINRTSISPERYSDIYGTLLGYTEGSPIIVDYYNQNAPMHNQQTQEIDISSFRHSVHTDYLLVHDMELRLDGELSITYDEDTNVMLVTGSGITFPGFQPIIGDIFLYGLPDSQIGIFVVTSVQRLSIHQASHHRINFSLYTFADNDELTKLNTSVNDEAYFDKQKFLTNNATLLKSTEYINLVDLRRYRRILIEHYFKKFYSNNLQTLMRPDDIYDPYIVEFFHAKVSMLDTKHRPTQIYPEMTDNFASIWFLLTEATHTDIGSLQSKRYIVTHLNELWDATISPLINKQFIHLNDAETINAKSDLLIVEEDETVDTSYAFSEAFYLGRFETLDPDNEPIMSNFESILYMAIITGEIDAATLVNSYLKTFGSLSSLDQFYHIPAYIYLIDLAIANIT